MVMDKTFKVQFPFPYLKFYEKHVKYFKAEVIVCIFKKTHLQVKT